MLLESDNGGVSIQRLIADRVCYRRVGEGKIPVLTRDLDFIEDGFSIVQVMSRFVSGETLTCELSDGRLAISNLGKVVCSFLEYDYCGLRKALDGSRGHPYLSVMEKIIDAYRKQDVVGWSFGIDAEGLKELEDCVRLEIKCGGGADALRVAARSMVRGIRKNYASLDAFISGLASKEHGLNAVSVDLRYVHDVFYESGEGHSVELVKRDLDALLKIVDREFSDSISGYFWRLEFGLGNKFYARVVFFIDGAAVSGFFDFVKGKASSDVLRISKDCFLNVYEFVDGEDSPDICIESSPEYWEKVKGNAALLLAADELIRVDYSNRRVYGRSGLAVKCRSKSFRVF